MDFMTYFDIHSVDDAEFGPPEQYSAGYLDNVLTIFERHEQRFVLVGNVAMQWCGTPRLRGVEVDILVENNKLEPIALDLVSSGEWGFSSDPYYSKLLGMRSFQNTTPIRDIWLVTCNEHHSSSTCGPQYLRLWPEALYQLSSIDCRKIEVPDLHNTTGVLLEEEYFRVPQGEYGSPRLSDLQARSETILFDPPRRSKRVRRDIPIFIPIIEDHLNALLDQLVKQRQTNLRCGNIPGLRITHFIQSHNWDLSPAREWLLTNKVCERNCEEMKRKLDDYWRFPDLPRASTLCSLPPNSQSPVQPHDESNVEDVDFAVEKSSKI